MRNTNLTKAFIHSAVFVLIIIQLIGCGANKTTPAEAKSPFFIGKWSVSNIISPEYETLDSTSKMVYTNQMNTMLDSSYVLLRADSSYVMQIGPDLEKGVWITDDEQNRLVLKSDKKSITRYRITHKKMNSFRLGNIDDKDSLKMELIKN